VIGVFLVAWFTILRATALERKTIAMPDANGNEIVITTVYDNYAVDTRLTKSWGFAAAVVFPAATILFDTGGDSSILLANMRQMKIDPKGVHAVVISHIHGDHLDGLQGLLAQNSEVRAFIPAAFPDSVRNMIRATGADFVDVTGPIEVIPGVSATGPLGDGLDEQALVVETNAGLVVMTGCAHPGIVHVVKEAHDQRLGQPIALVMGGFHLLSADAADVAGIIDSFRRLGVKKVAPSHCTGDAARSQFRKAYGPDFIEGGAGMILSFNRATTAPSR
jgi:7,8-dihydropterin-6-yl-methyl-4-(beta-D-ribofuranosyl)aminobenzene 5'-phosphate synthase